MGDLAVAAAAASRSSITAAAAAAGANAVQARALGAANGDARISKGGCNRRQSPRRLVVIGGDRQRLTEISGLA